MPTNDEKLVNLSDLKVAYDDLDLNKVDKSGDTMTGPLTTNSAIIQNSGYIFGSNENGATNHALKLGHNSDNVMQFFEHGGQFDFIKSMSGSNTTLFQIKDGVSAYPLPVNNGGTGATTPAGARANLGITPSNIGAVAKSGDSMTGGLTLGGAIHATYNIAVKSDWPYYGMEDMNSHTVSLLATSVSDHTIMFREYNSTFQASEEYKLPTPTIIDTESGPKSQIYNILTTKEPVKVEQGGTGATDAAGARMNLGITLENIGAVAKTGDTMTGALTIDDANTTPNQYAEIARFKRPAMQNNDNVMLYLGKAFSTKNCGTILYHHAGDGSDSNYLALSAYNAPQSLRSYVDGHIELTGTLKTDSNIVQTAGYIFGSDNDYHNHGIKLGHTNNNEMHFYEFGGVFTFYKSVNNVDTPLLQIKDGASGAPLRVDNGGTGATAADGARTNLGIYSGSLVTSFDNGTATLPFSTFGLSSRPYTLVAILNSGDGFIRYDWDNSASNIVLICLNPSGVPFTGTIRLSWIAIP